MTPDTRRILGRPALHLLAAGVAFAAFVAPLTLDVSPASRLVLIYVTWCLTVPILFALTRGESAEEDEP